MFDAYTVKKVLPRLAIAVIAIQLSFFIFSNMVTITNDIAFGIEGLIYGAFGGTDEFSLQALLTNGSFSTVETGLTTIFIGAAAAAFSGGVLAIIGLVLVALIIAFLTLTLRKMMLIFLIVISPIALVAWILPNTERLWKMWWDNFSKLLLMFPIILGMVAIGRVFGKIAAGNSGNDIVDITIVLGGFFIPLALIPKTYKFAGGAMATVGGAIQQNAEKGGAAAVGKGKEAWGNTRWGLRKQGKKDAKLNVRKQRETATGINKAISGKGIGSQIYKRVGMKPTDIHTLQAGADKALIESEAQGHIHAGTSSEELQELAYSAKTKQGRQAALVAMAMQGDGAGIAAVQKKIHDNLNTDQGQENAHMYTQALNTHYDMFKGAGAGTTVPTGSLDNNTGKYIPSANFDDERIAKIRTMSDSDKARMTARQWQAAAETNPAEAQRIHADLVAEAQRRAAAGDHQLEDILAIDNWSNVPAPPRTRTSDMRLKKDVLHLMTLSNGIRIYKFKYLWSDTEYVGVIAQDLLKTRPDSVVVDQYGYYRVKYESLGLRMVTYQEWQKHGAYSIFLQKEMT